MAPSDSTDTGQPGGQSLVEFYCPHCKNILSAPSIHIGEVTRCSKCDSDCKVPKKRLSLSGDLPKGRIIEPVPPEPEEVLADKPRLSMGSEGAGRKSVALGKPLDTHSTPNKHIERGSRRSKAPLKAIVSLTVICAVVGGAYYAYQSGLLVSSDSPATAESTKPSERVVFNKIDLAFERIQKAILSSEINESDILALKMLQDMAETDDSMSAEVEVFMTGIAKRRQAIEQDLRIAAESAAELATYSQRWDGYIETLFRQKIQQADDAGKQLKLDWLNALLSIIQAAPENNSQIESYILQKIRTRGKWNDSL